MTIFLDFLSVLPANALVILIFCIFAFLTMLLLLIVFVPNATDRIYKALATFQNLFYSEKQRNTSSYTQKRFRKGVGEREYD